MVVIDPRVTENRSDGRLPPSGATRSDAWLLAAMVAILVEEGLVDLTWLGSHASGFEPALIAFRDVPISRYCEISGVDETLVRAATRRIAAAASVATFGDLGVQMIRHSTLVSYLEKLVWLLTGTSPSRWAVRDDRHREMLRMRSSELRPAGAPCLPWSARR